MRTTLALMLLLLTFPLMCQKTEVICNSQAPKPIGPYSQAVKCGNTMYVSGQIALRFDGSLDTASIESEVKQIMANIEKVLESGNMKLSNIVKSTIYVTDLRYFKSLNEAYGAYFTANPPARETVEVKGLPKGARVEISVIAVQ